MVDGGGRWEFTEEQYLCKHIVLVYSTIWTNELHAICRLTLKPRCAHELVMFEVISGGGGAVKNML